MSILCPRCGDLMDMDSREDKSHQKAMRIKCAKYDASKKAVKDSGVYSAKNEMPPIGRGLELKRKKKNIADNYYGPEYPVTEVCKRCEVIERGTRYKLQKGAVHCVCFECGEEWVYLADAPQSMALRKNIGVKPKELLSVCYQECQDHS